MHLLTATGSPQGHLILNLLTHMIMLDMTRKNLTNRLHQPKLPSSPFAILEYDLFALSFLIKLIIASAAYYVMVYIGATAYFCVLLCIAASAKYDVVQERASCIEASRFGRPPYSLQGALSRPTQPTTSHGTRKVLVRN